MARPTKPSKQAPEPAYIEIEHVVDPDCYLHTTKEALDVLKRLPEVFSELQMNVVIGCLQQTSFATLYALIKKINSPKYDWLKAEFVADTVIKLIQRGHLSLEYRTPKQSALTFEGELTIDPESGTITFVPTDPRVTEMLGRGFTLLTISDLPTPIPTNQALAIRQGKPNWKPGTAQQPAKRKQQKEGK